MASALKINYCFTLIFPFLFSSFTPATIHTAARGALKKIQPAIPLKLWNIISCVWAFFSVEGGQIPDRFLLDNQMPRILPQCDGLFVHLTQSNNNHKKIKNKYLTHTQSKGQELKLQHILIRHRLGDPLITGFDSKHEKWLVFISLFHILGIWETLPMTKQCS